MKERYHQQMSAYIRKIESCDIPETAKLHLISELIKRKINKIQVLIEKPENIMEHMWYVSKQYCDIEILRELQEDVLNIKWSNKY